MKPIAVSLALALSLGASCHADAASPSHPRHAQQVPVVATWFSNLHPAPGQREVLNVQFFRSKQGLAGGRFSATIHDGRHTMRVKGGITNARGIASASFTIPRGLGGTVLHAASVVLFKGMQYRGSNHVRVDHGGAHP